MQAEQKQWSKGIRMGKFRTCSGNEEWFNLSETEGGHGK